MVGLVQLTKGGGESPWNRRECVIMSCLFSTFLLTCLLSTALYLLLSGRSLGLNPPLKKEKEKKGQESQGLLLRTQHVVVLISMTYYSERFQSIVNRGKICMGEV